MFNTKNTQFLDYFYEGEHLCIYPWGHGLRVHDSFFDGMHNWALTEKSDFDSNFAVTYNDDEATIVNGKTKAIVNKNGKITFYDKNKIILEEFWRERNFRKIKINNSQFLNQKENEYSSALKIKARDFCPNNKGSYEVAVRFEANDNEKIYGMGQYQQSQLNLKGCKLELAQRNSQTTVPFLISNYGYGLLWNNPGIGEVTFANNITEWKNIDTDCIDYWICAEDTPKEIISAYTDVTGHSPKMPKYALGLWQSKLRYRNQNEVISIAKHYHDLHIPLSVIVIDYFHWPKQGDFKFDKRYFPNPEKMVKDLKKLNVELMVSVWPNIDCTSENYNEMNKKGYLVRADKGKSITMTFHGNTTFFDTTNPEARLFVWNRIKRNYYQKGVKHFWLDEAEPEYSTYDFDNYRLQLGRNSQVGNIYSALYARGFYEGEKREGQNNPISLIRSAWAGSQKYGALVWSGDIDSSFRSFKYQYQAGLNIGLAGIPWWTSDIGGFHGGSSTDSEFKELLIRWFEFAVYCPVLRMHGDREPHEFPIDNQVEGTGAPNEIWSFGKETFDILRKQVNIRESLKPYINSCMNEAHKKGYPVMRTLFFEFPEDKASWNIEDEYMFGRKYLVAPIFEFGKRRRQVYLPLGSRWKDINKGSIRSGGIWINCEAPLDRIPIFERVDY